MGEDESTFSLKACVLDNPPILYSRTVEDGQYRMANFFESMMNVEGVSAKTATSLLTVELLGRLKGEFNITNSPVDADKLGFLAKRIDDKTISGKAAKEVLDYLMENAQVSVDDAIDTLGLKQVTDTGAIEAMCDEIINAKISDFISEKLFYGLCKITIKGLSKQEVKINQLKQNGYEVYSLDVVDEFAILFIYPKV